MTKRVQTKGGRTKSNAQDLPANPSADDLPAHPSAEDMEKWDPEMLLQWIKKRDPVILKPDTHLENFTKEYITGKAFLLSDIAFYHTCGLPRGVGQVLKSLADEVKEGKLIP
jgi:hypothetical protein